MISPVKIWRNQKKITSLLGKRGTIVTWTFIRVPPAGYSNLAPYPVALILCEDKTMMTVQIVDWDTHHLKIGQTVQTVIRRAMKTNEDGIIPYGVKAVPLDE